MLHITRWRARCVAAAFAATLVFAPPTAAVEAQPVSIGAAAAIRRLSLPIARGKVIETIRLPETRLFQAPAPGAPCA